MIHTQVCAERVRLLMDDGDEQAFVDRDWVPRAAGIATPGLVFDSTGSLWWGNQKQPPSGDARPYVRATRELASFASNISDTVSHLPPKRVWVIGRGVTAELVRRCTRCRPGGPDLRPAAVIEMTGGASELATATRAVEDGGLVVLAGEFQGPVELNMYTDVHRRGLQIVGVPGLGHTHASDAGDRTEVPVPACVESGDELPDSLWYRIIRRAEPEEK